MKLFPRKAPGSSVVERLVGGTLNFYMDPSAFIDPAGTVCMHLQSLSLCDDFRVCSDRVLYLSSVALNLAPFGPLLYSESRLILTHAIYS
jgi:hypothetical protein